MTKTSKEDLGKIAKVIRQKDKMYSMYRFEDLNDGAIIDCIHSPVVIFECNAAVLSVSHKPYMMVACICRMARICCVSHHHHYQLLQGK